jgi:hypothetical protein
MNWKKDIKIKLSLTIADTNTFIWQGKKKILSFV